MGYKHGLSGKTLASSESITNSKNIPVYIGIAPVFRVKERSDELKPMLIRNLTEAQLKLGYKADDNFNEYTLSACVYAHFQNQIKPIGPIIVINVLDVNKHGTSSTESVEISNKVGIINKNVDINSVKISDKVEGIDYKLSYTDEGYLKITILTDDEIESPISVSCKTINICEITENDILGSYDEEKDSRSGIMAIEDIYEGLNKIPTMLSAPGYNHLPKVHNALVALKSGISDMWESTCFTDIDDKVATTREKAIEWKEEKGYNSSAEKVFWPKGIMAGKEIWLSIIAIVAKMQTDSDNNDIPYQSPSNKQIDITGLIVNGNKIKISQSKANELNQNGITTAIFNGGKYVLWGPHMASFSYGTTDKPDEIFDTNVFMHKYLINDFNVRNGNLIDKAMTRNDVDSLINQENTILAAHVSAGRLLYGSVEFSKDLNSNSDIVNGDFAIKSLVTEAPLAKSLTNYVQYTSEGINSLYSDEESEE